MRWLLQVQAGQMVGLRAVSLVAHHQLAHLATTEALVIVQGREVRLDLALLDLLLFLLLLAAALARPFADEAAAVLRVAQALRLLVTSTLQIVVERQLGAGRYVACGEQTDAVLVVHHPFLSHAVRLTAVVHESVRRFGGGGEEKVSR